MELTIKINCDNGLEMENNLNKAIEDFGQALLKKGFSEMELIGYTSENDLKEIYNVTIKTM